MPYTLHGPGLALGRAAPLPPVHLDISVPGLSCPGCTFLHSGRLPARIVVVFGTDRARFWGTELTRLALRDVWR